MSHVTTFSYEVWYFSPTTNFVVTWGFYSTIKEARAARAEARSVYGNGTIAVL